MDLSRRITGLTGGGSDGWGMYWKSQRMIAAGHRVIQLTIGEHDIKTDATILDAMHRAALGGATGYAAIPGIPRLRRAIAERVSARTGLATRPENVLVTPGGQAALFACHHAVCDEGDRALFCDPHYATYPGTIRAVGAVPVPVACRPEDGFHPRGGAIRAAADGAKSLLINSPNNPTGALYGRETMDAIASACREADLWLISDEVYETQVWEGEMISPRALPGMEERTLVIGSMSKGHAMTGSRVGWIVGPEAAIERMMSLSIHTTYGVAGFVQEAALFALEQGPAFEAQIAAPFRRRREIALRLLEGQNVVRAIPPEGAMYMMLDIRATGLSGTGFAEALLEEEKIAVMPGESFGQAAAGHLRVAMTVADAEFEDAMTRLLGFAGRMA